MKLMMREGLARKDVQRFVGEIFEGDIHAKRVLSLANATTGVLAAGTLAVSAIGQGLAPVCGLPLIWHTVRKSELKGNRNHFEDSVLERLSETLPEGVAVTVIATP
jgi:hypothetical protein